MTSIFFLYDLLKYGFNSEFEKLELDTANLSNIFSLSLIQGVSGIAFKSLRNIMQMQGIDKNKLNGSCNIYDKWFATTTGIILHHNKILRLQNKLSIQLKELGIKAIVLKGLSLAEFYRDNQLRAFGDLDIYSPFEYQKLDNFLKSISSNFSLDYYRHSECKIDNVMVENHRYLTDVRGQKRFHNLEKFLHNEAIKSLSTTSEGGLFYPNETFIFIFFIYHALIHFLYEKLTLKFLVDWCLMLKGRKEIELSTIDQKLNEYGMMHFAAVMTAICIERLGLDKAFVSKDLLEEVKLLTPDLIKKFEEDIFMNSNEKFSTNSLKDRIKRGKDLYKRSWKIKEFLNVSPSIFLLEKVWSLRDHKIDLYR